MSTCTKTDTERVVDPSGWDDGTFLIEGVFGNDGARRHISEFLDETLGKDGWANLVVNGTSRWRGDWSEGHWISRAAGSPWTYVVADYETPDELRDEYWQT